jgi:hypothetical protein
MVSSQEKMSPLLEDELNLASFIINFNSFLQIVRSAEAEILRPRKKRYSFHCYIALLKSHAEKNFGMISIETWVLFMSTFDLDIGNKWRNMRGSCCRLDVQDRCIHSPCVCGPG